MKKRKQWLALACNLMVLILLVTMVGSSVPVFASLTLSNGDVQLQFNGQDYTVTVSGNTPAGIGKNVSVSIIKQGAIGNDAVLYVRNTVAVAQGLFSFSLTVPDYRWTGADATGTYDVFVSGEAITKTKVGTFDFVSSPVRSAFISQIQQTANGNALMSLLESEANEKILTSLEFDTEVYNSLGSLKSEVLNRMVRRRADITSGATLNAVMNESKLLSPVNSVSDSNSLMVYLSVYTQEPYKLLDLDLEGVSYPSLKSEVKKWVCERVLDGRGSTGYDTVTQYKNRLKKAYVLSLLNNTLYAGVEEIFYKYKNILGIENHEDYKEYLSSSDMKKYCNTQLVSKVDKNELETEQEFITVFESIAEAWRDNLPDEDSGDRSTSSKSSKGSTVVSVSPLQPVPTVAPDERKTFIDLGNTSWAKESIEVLAAKNIVQGKGNNQFMPDDKVTREEFVKMLVAAFGLLDASASTAYTDLKPEAWYTSYIASAQKLEIVKGLDDKTFGLGKEITRQEMAVLAYRAAKVKNIQLKTVNTEILFEDQENIDNYAQESIQSMQKAGIINGMGNNLFGPRELSTRAQAAKIVYALLQFIQ